MTKLIILIAVALTLLGAGCQKIASPQTGTPASAVVEYRNEEYGFRFALPESWAGFTVLDEYWEGQGLDAHAGESFTGPKITIRHPAWTAERPRQDIPILILAHVQWDLIEQELLSLGAAPIPPSELGRNDRYVFALPARYNYAFPDGFEEVEQIIASHSLVAE